MDLFIDLVRENLVIPVFVFFQENPFGHDFFPDQYYQNRFIKNLGCSLDDLFEFETYEYYFQEPEDTYTQKK